MAVLMDRISQPVYDAMRCDAGVRNFLFSIPVGQGRTMFGSGPKHFGDTNMYIAGQLPAGWTMSVGSVVVETLQEERARDLIGAALRLFVGPTNFLTIPVNRCRASLVVTPEHAIGRAQLAELVRGVAPAALPMLLGSIPGLAYGFTLERELLITPTQNFSVEVHLPTGSAELRVYLCGILGRLVQ